MLKFTTSKRYGQLTIEFNNTNGIGARASRDLLRKLIENTVERCFSYYCKTKDHAFIYGERELNSVICPSIAAITPAFLMENVLTRKRR
jgi:hypothetical protein